MFSRFRPALGLPVLLIGLLLALSPCFATAQRIAPPPSEIHIPEAVRSGLQAGLGALNGEIELTREAVESKPALRELLPDVLVFSKAVDFALNYDEFFHTNEFAVAEELLAEGTARARALRAGDAPWTRATGLVVRGYRSRIDGSAQPYGLVVPAGWTPDAVIPIRLDVWLHGRDNHLTDLKFIAGRRRGRGEFAPDDAIVLHPYGRYCNAFKFAGETDVFEALAHAREHYRIDERRVAIRGFSMGGAGVWHLAAHHPGRWFVATPGAGFAESPEYLNVWSKPPEPAWFEQTLWGLYNATDYALNFHNLPVIAYDGDQDKQQQAADIMEAAMSEQGLQLARVKGLNVGHKYTPEAKTTLSTAVDSLARNVPSGVPRKVRFTTRTLRYPRSHWVELEGLVEHWKPATVEAAFANRGIQIEAENVSALRLRFATGEWPDAVGGGVAVSINGTALNLPGAASDRSWEAALHRTDGRWMVGTPKADEPRKRPGLQGPIDDVWFDSFLIVVPSGRAMNGTVGDWVKREQERAIREWRNQFRGHPRVKTDQEVTAEDIDQHHLVVFGDPHSNLVLQRALSRLPLSWNQERVQLGGESVSSASHAPVLIYPNPLNPDRYLVLNSGFTWRDFPSNADQTPKLPDYALINVTEAPTRKTPGGVVTAGFFDEHWKLKSRAAGGQTR